MKPVKEKKIAEKSRPGRSGQHKNKPQKMVRKLIYIIYDPPRNKSGQVHKRGVLLWTGKGCWCPKIIRNIHIIMSDITAEEPATGSSHPVFQLRDQQDLAVAAGPERRGFPDL